MKARSRPPLWLIGAGLASVWWAAHAIAVWILLFTVMPVHEDIRLTYVAAKAGVRYGWSTIYDQSTLRALSAAFPLEQQRIDSLYTYLHPPLVAWLFAPLTAFDEPVAYVIWTIVSLVALVVAWHVAAPYTGLAKVTLLLIAVGMWPVLSTLYYGQPNLLVIACVAGSWWLVKRDRALAAGIALALATFIKPQLIWLLPPAILVSGRIRVVSGWAMGCAGLALLSALALGPDGLFSWYRALQAGQGDPSHTVNTLIYFFGLGPVTLFVWTIFGVAALSVAFRHRADADMVFTAGLLGSALVTFHFHELDWVVVIPAAWFFLRTSPPLWQRLWLLLGVGALEMLTLESTGGPGWAVPSSATAIAWAATWLGILVANSFAPAPTSAVGRVLLHTKDAQEKAREDRLHA